MQHAPWTVRSAGWPVTSKMTLALIAKDIGKSSSYFESLASVRVNKRPLFGSGSRVPSCIGLRGYARIPETNPNLVSSKNSLLGATRFSNSPI